jgi:hypothetical protein
MARTLTARELGRATLARQMLLGVVRATFLADGAVAGTWSRDKDRTVALEPFGRLSKRDRAPLDEEAVQLRQWAAG